MPAKKKQTPPIIAGDFDSLVTSIVYLHQQTQDFATKAVNVALTLRNWLIGHRIVEFEQQGNDRAAYGERLLPALAERLSAAGLKRVDVRELRRFRLLYEVYPQIRETVTPELLAWLGAGVLQPPLNALLQPKRETLSPESQIVETVPPQLVQRLSFSHFAELIDLPDDTQRRFYEIECIRGNWSVRELRRQIDSLYYQRSGLSKNKAKLSAIAHAAADILRPAHIIRDPYIFEFLGLRSRDVMAESDLEDALLDRLQDFLLELGHGFCFEARQKRILIGDEHFFIDLVFYHRVLKCHILVELKTDAFRHEHLGQLNTYVAYQPRATPWVIRRKNALSPEGATHLQHPTMARPFRAKWEWNPKPRAMPWAGMTRTVGAEEAERDLLFHDTVAPHLAASAPEASAAQQRDFLTHLHQTLNAPSHPIRNRLLRLPADSPDLLAIIKAEGRV